MRLLDLELSVQQQLNDLPYPAYLLSMSVIVRRLGEVYADVLPREGRQLAAQTANAAKAAYLSGQPAADEALQLDRRWMELIERPGIDGPLGMAPCTPWTRWHVNWPGTSDRALRLTLSPMQPICQIPRPLAP